MESGKTSGKGTWFINGKLGHYDEDNTSEKLVRLCRYNTPV
jgi:hypothetical protein